MRQCDVVVTNPPFSLFGKFLRQIMSYDKKFLVIGAFANMGTAIEVCGSTNVRVGVTKINTAYLRPDGSRKSVATVWLTNIDHGVVLPPLPSKGRRYDPSEYEFTDCGILHVGPVADIPIDYFGPMAVVETYFKYHDPNLFTVADRCIHPRVGGKNVYKRLVIQRNLGQADVTCVTNSELKMSRTDGIMEGQNERQHHGY